MLSVFDRGVLALLLTVVCSVCGAQTSFPVKEVNAKHLCVTTLGNIYVYNQTSIGKYAPDGTCVATFSSKKYRNITDVDVSNPFKIRVFYGDDMTILELNHNLSLLGTVEFDSDNTSNTDLYCNSDSESFWIYDAQENTLNKYLYKSPLAEYQFSSNVVLHLIQTGVMSVDDRIIYMFKHNGRILLVSKYMHVVQLDKQGNLVSHYVASDIEIVKPCGEKAYVVTHNSEPNLSRIHSVGEEQRAFDIHSQYSDFDIYKDKIYLLKNDSIDIQDLEFD